MLQEGLGFRVGDVEMNIAVDVVVDNCRWE